MFDLKQSLTLTGTVKVFQWTNPHCWIQLDVADSGQPVEWSIEMGSTTELFRNGWRPATLQAGGRIKVVIHPVRDGKHGGVFVSATAEDGAPLVAKGKG